MVEMAVGEVARDGRPGQRRLEGGSPEAECHIPTRCWAADPKLSATKESPRSLPYPVQLKIHT
jgi:hypothetical protein